MSRANEMRELFARWRSSGQSLMAFGKQEGVSYAKLLYWRRKLEGESRQAAALAEKPIELMPVEVVTAPSPELAVSPKFEVWLANGLSVDLAPGFDEKELRRLIGVLQSC